MTSNSIKEKIYNILENPAKDQRFARSVNLFLFGLIIINVLAVIMETEHSFKTSFHSLFQYIEIISVIVFSIEYLARLYVCTLNEKYRGSIIGRFRFIISPMALIDLLAILPFYIPRFIRIDLRFIRVLRLLRIIRLLKLARYSGSINLMANVLRRKKEELIIIIGLLLILLILSASLMYVAEHNAQPEIFSSIFSAIWWSVATLSTVGYGDIYPITPFGKVLGSFISILGIGLFALPTAILGSGFLEEFNKSKQKDSKCPHCGKDI